MTQVKLNRQPIQKGFSSLIDEILNEVPLKFHTDWNGQYVPPVNIHETEDAFHLEMNAPGRNKEDFKINVEESILTISYEKKQENSNAGHKTVRREFSFESFKRSFNIRDEIKADDIQAKYENGVLRLLLPKKPVVKESAKQINIQ